MKKELDYENCTPYSVVAKKDGSKIDLWGTDYKVPAVSVSMTYDETSFVYYATNESGTTSYGEGFYDDFYKV